MLRAVNKRQSLCTLRAAGQDPDSFSNKTTLPNLIVDNVDAGSALLRYAGSLAPRSPPLHALMNSNLKLDDPSAQGHTLSDSTSDLASRPLTPRESKTGNLDRLRRAENQRTGLHNAARDDVDLIEQLMTEEGADVRFAVLYYTE